MDNTLWKLTCSDGYCALVTAANEASARQIAANSAAWRGDIRSAIDVSDLYSDHDGFDDVIGHDAASVVAVWQPSMATPPQLRLAGHRRIRPAPADTTTVGESAVDEHESITTTS